MGACVICDLLSGSLPVSLVHRDPLCAVVVDIRPVNPGHVLVVPVRHAASLAELTDAEGAAMFALARRMGAALRASGLRCEGVNLFVADGEAAGQEVFHAHLHVFPRFAGDGFGLRFGPDYRRARREEMDRVAALLAESLAAFDRGEDDGDRG
jgi:diadenosine tetraphosphate (Ap4A) HIT family hydrolase